MDAPLCKCHNEPLLWNRDQRYRAGGFWKCRIHRRKIDKDRYEKDPRSKIVATKRAKLRRQRVRVLDKLARLKEEEAILLGTQS